MKFGFFQIFRSCFLFFLWFPLRADRLDKCLHSVGAFCFHLFRNMAIGIQGKCSGCMAEILLDCLHIVTGTERSNCIRVAKVMEADQGHPQFCHNQLECPVSCLGSDPVSGLIREYQTGFFVEILVILSVSGNAAGIRAQILWPLGRNPIPKENTSHFLKSTLSYFFGKISLLFL